MTAPSLVILLQLLLLQLLAAPVPRTPVPTTPAPLPSTAAAPPRFVVPSHAARQHQTFPGP